MMPIRNRHSGPQITGARGVRTIAGGSATRQHTTESQIKHARVPSRLFCHRRPAFVFFSHQLDKRAKNDISPYSVLQRLQAAVQSVPSFPRRFGQRTIHDRSEWRLLLRPRLREDDDILRHSIYELDGLCDQEQQQDICFDTLDDIDLSHDDLSVPYFGRFCFGA
jgi:hypothetical protein